MTFQAKFGLFLLMAGATGLYLASKKKEESITDVQDVDFEEIKQTASVASPEKNLDGGLQNGSTFNNKSQQISVDNEAGGNSLAKSFTSESDKTNMIPTTVDDFDDKQIFSCGL